MEYPMQQPFRSMARQLADDHGLPLGRGLHMIALATGARSWQQLIASPRRSAPEEARSALFAYAARLGLMKAADAAWRAAQPSPAGSPSSVPVDLALQALRPAGQGFPVGVDISGQLRRLDVPVLRVMGGPGSGKTSRMGDVAVLDALIQGQAAISLGCRDPEALDDEALRRLRMAHVLGLPAELWLPRGLYFDPSKVPSWVCIRRFEPLDLLLRWPERSSSVSRLLLSDMAGKLGDSPHAVALLDEVEQGLSAFLRDFAGRHQLHERQVGLWELSMSSSAKQWPEIPWAPELLGLAKPAMLALQDLKSPWDDADQRLGLAPGRAWELLHQLFGRQPAGEALARAEQLLHLGPAEPLSPSRAGVSEIHVHGRTAMASLCLQLALDTLLQDLHSAPSEALLCLNAWELGSSLGGGLPLGLRVLIGEHNTDQGRVALGDGYELVTQLPCLAFPGYLKMSDAVALSGRGEDAFFDWPNGTARLWDDPTPLSLPRLDQLECPRIPRWCDPSSGVAQPAAYVAGLCRFVDPTPLAPAFPNPWRPLAQELDRRLRRQGLPRITDR